MSRYASGRRAEYRARNELRRRGYTVIRAAGSKGPCDLVALRDSHVLLVQVKRGRRRPSPSEYAELAILQVPLAVQRQVWWYPPRKGMEVVWPVL